MRHFTAILLLFLFAANISGVCISYHYCEKIFQYAAISGNEEETICCCGGREKKSCCETQYCKVKLDEHKSFAQKVIFDKQTVVEATIPTPVFIPRQTVVVPYLLYSIPCAHAPPPLVQTVSLHILHQQFLI